MERLSSFAVRYAAALVILFLLVGLQMQLGVSRVSGDEPIQQGDNTGDQTGDHLVCSFFNPCTLPPWWATPGLSFPPPASGTLLSFGNPVGPTIGQLAPGMFAPPNCSGLQSIPQTALSAAQILESVVNGGQSGFYGLNLTPNANGYRPIMGATGALPPAVNGTPAFPVACLSNLPATSATLLASASLPTNTVVVANYVGGLTGSSSIGSGPSTQTIDLTGPGANPITLQPGCNSLTVNAGSGASISKLLPQVSTAGRVTSISVFNSTLNNYQFLWFDTPGAAPSDASIGSGSQQLVICTGG